MTTKYVRCILKLSKLSSSSSLSSSFSYLSPLSSSFLFSPFSSSLLSSCLLSIKFPSFLPIKSIRYTTLDLSRFKLFVYISSSFLTQRIKLVYLYLTISGVGIRYERRFTPLFTKYFNLIFFGSSKIFLVQSWIKYVVAINIFSLEFKDNWLYYLI